MTLTADDFSGMYARPIQKRLGQSQIGLQPRP